VQCDSVVLLIDLDSSQLLQLDLPEVAGPHIPLGMAGEVELLHGHHPVHNIVQGHDAGELGDEDEMGVKITGELADVLLEAVLRGAYQMRGVVQDCIPAIDYDHGVVHILCLLEEDPEEVQNSIIAGKLLARLTQALQELGLGGIDHIPGH